MKSPRIVCAIVVLAAPAACWAQVGQKATKQPASYAKVEIAGILRVQGKPKRNDGLECLFSSQRGVKFATVSSVATGVTIWNGRLGEASVYLSDDKHLLKVAERLNGKNVVLCGELAQVFLWDDFMAQAPMLSGQRLPPQMWLVIRASSIKENAR